MVTVSLLTRVFTVTSLQAILIDYALKHFLDTIFVVTEIAETKTIHRSIVIQRRLEAVNNAWPRRDGHIERFLC